jgi:hypothetical protein
MKHGCTADPTMPGTVDESTGPVITASTAPVESHHPPSSYPIFASAVVAALRARPGSGAESAARAFARRMAHEIYLEDCRAALFRRDKWLALLVAQMSGTTSEREGA